IINRVVDNTLEAMGKPKVKSGAKLETPLFDYDLHILNADCDISQVSRGIVENGGARVCLYGPAGTGKSAFGRHIADVSGKPLLLKKASDILSPYLGESEQNMAKMFREAVDRDAVLVLDEADTFL